MILTVIIPTTKFKKKYFDQLLATLLPQLKDLDGKIEVLADAGKDPIGMKIKAMLDEAQGKYIWIVNHNFLLADYAIAEIFKLAEESPEVMEIKGMTLIKDKTPYDWRGVSSNSPMLTEFARKLKHFKDDKKQRGEILRHNPIIKLLEKPIIQKRVF